MSRPYQPVADLVAQPVDELEALRVSLATERAGRLRAEAADAAKDAYLARLGHDWRTPLSAISAAADVLDGVAFAEDPLAREARDIIRRQALGLAGRIDAVLDATRLIAGRSVLSRCRFDLAEAAGQAVAAAQSNGLAEGRELRLTCCEAQADVDPARVVQAVTHLLANALRFTPPGGEVEVEVGTDPSGPYLRTRDAGPGIAPADAAMLIHGPDVLLGGMPRRDGLGLRFVQALMSLLGGRCEVESSPCGTVVTLRFQAPSALPSATPIARADASGPRRALFVVGDVVDEADDGASCERLASWLEAAGYAVAYSTRGEGGKTIAAVGAGLTLVAVDDTHGGSGPTSANLAFVRQARASGHAGRVLALVDRPPNGPEARALRVAGFDGHLVRTTDQPAFMREIADA